MKTYWKLNTKRTDDDWVVLKYSYKNEQNICFRKEYYYEHLGMMDVVSYANGNVGKIREYEKMGYIQGQNIIYTFETSTQQIQGPELEQIIKTYFW